MRFHYFVYASLLLYIISCSDSPRSSKLIQNKIENKATTNKKPSSSFNDTLVIKSSAAVFYSPDSLQLEKIKLGTDAGTFEATMHENFFLMRNARVVIRQYYPKLKIIEAKNVRYLLFIKNDKSGDCIDLDTKKEVYGLFLFNPPKPEQLADMANINTELGFYFSK